jgi:preflagellin peptidase FlaK
VLLDLARLLLGVSVLAFASYTDWRWRRAPNALWAVLGGAGVLLLLVEALSDPAPWSARWPYLLGIPVVVFLLSDSDALDLIAGVLGLGGAAAVGVLARVAPEMLPARWPFLLAVPVFAAVIYLFYRFGLIAGGADAKALMALGTLAPFPLALAEGVPPLAGPLPGALTILTDSLLLFLLIPISLAIWNLAHGDARFPNLFLGVKRPARDVRQGHAWPMETVAEDGTRGTRLMASRMSEEEIAASFERIQALGDERVWVSPKIPFMIPLLAGFVCAFFAGDLLFALMRLAHPL